MMKKEGEGSRFVPKTGKDFEDVKEVFHVLRHKCKHVKKAEKAIEKIVEETNLSRQRVESILEYTFKSRRF